MKCNRLHRITTPDGKVRYLEGWWDRGTRSWVVQTKDAIGNQVGAATFVGTRAGAEYELDRRKEELENA